MTEHVARLFGPKEEIRESDVPCPACHKDFKIGDYTTLIPVGPGENVTEQRKCKRGVSYNAVAAEVHYLCATGKNPE